MAIDPRIPHGTPPTPALRPLPPRDPEPIRSHAHAADTLDDAPFIAYVLVQGFKLMMSLFCKRWPQLR